MVDSLLCSNRRGWTRDSVRQNNSLRDLDDVHRRRRPMPPKATQISVSVLGSGRGIGNGAGSTPLIPFGEVST
jgi:hypothetical protein